MLSTTGCTGTHRFAQFTGRSSWNDAYKKFILPIITAGGPVGINISNISRLIKANTVTSPLLKKMARYISDLPPEVNFIWQNSVGVATPDREVKGNETAVHPAWR